MKKIFSLFCLFYVYKDCAFILKPSNSFINLVLALLGNSPFENETKKLKFFTETKIAEEKLLCK